MGSSAYERAKSMGMEISPTGEMQIEASIHAYRDGKLATDMRRVHNH
jgi:hypothetical protein